MADKLDGILDSIIIPTGETSRKLKVYAKSAIIDWAVGKVDKLRIKGTSTSPSAYVRGQDNGFNQAIDEAIKNLKGDNNGR